MNRFLLIASTLALLGAGCPVNPSLTLPEINVNVMTLEHYSNDNLGLSFDYPASWGPVNVKIERGENGCVYQRALFFSGIADEPIFLAAVDHDGCQPPSRGVYFGDKAAGFIPDLASQAFCETGEAQVCDTVTTAYGHILWHWHYDQYNSWGSIYENVDEYGAYRSGEELEGLILSTERLAASGLTDYTEPFAALASSLQFHP